MPIDTIFFKPLNKSMVIVHYIPDFFFCQIDLLKGWFSRLKSGKSIKKFEYRLPDSPWRLPDSPSLGVDDSLTRQVGELATPRLAESGSRRISDSPSFSFKHSKADSPTRRVGESFFDYEYLREFEAKSGTAQKVV
jgi:hypothetical protein